MVLPSGATIPIARRQVEKLIKNEQAEWIEDGISARRIATRNYVDYSAVFTERCRWRVRDSGGALVLQLV